MAKSNKGWCYSYDNSNFNGGTFDTKKLAIEDAQREGQLRNAEGEDNQFIYISQAEMAVNASFFPDADTITEHMACQAEDVGGEHADSYPDVSTEAENELTVALHNLLTDWCVKNDVSPTFYNVGPSKKYSLQTGQLVKS
jgi:hypothetical protein